MWNIVQWNWRKIETSSSPLNNSQPVEQQKPFPWHGNFTCSRWVWREFSLRVSFDRVLSSVMRSVCVYDASRKRSIRYLGPHLLFRLSSSDRQRQSLNNFREERFDISNRRNVHQLRFMYYLTTFLLEFLPVFFLIELLVIILLWIFKLGDSVWP